MTHVANRKYQKPRAANNAGLSSNCFEQRLKDAELFSGLFYVAASRLNSPRFSSVIETSAPCRVKIATRSLPFTIYRLRFTSLPFTILFHASRHLPRFVRSSHQRSSRHYSTRVQAFR